MKKLLITLIITIISIIGTNNVLASDKMSTGFLNMSKKSWLMITDYLYDNIEDTTTKALLQPITSNGNKADTMYTVLNTYLNDLNITNNTQTMIRKYRYAYSDLSNLTFIVYNKRIYIYTSEIWQRVNGTTGFTLEDFEKIDTATYTFNGSNLKFNGDTSSNTTFNNNRDYLYIDLNNYNITNSSGNYSNLGAQLTLNQYTVTQNDDLTLWSYGSNADSQMIVQFAGSGTKGNPIVIYYLKDYLSSSSTLYPMALKNAVYLDGSENTGGSTGGNTGTDTGGGNTGGNTGGGNVNVDLGQVEEQLGNISGGINNPDSTLNNNLNDIENAINNNTDYISKEPIYNENGELTEEQDGFIGHILKGFQNLFKWLFGWLFEIDEEYIGELIQTFSNNIQNNGSLIAVPMYLLTETMNLFIDYETSDFVISWENIDFQDITIIKSGAINFNEIINENEIFEKIYNTWILIESFGIIILLANWLRNLFFELLGIDWNGLKSDPEETISNTSTIDIDVTTGEIISERDTQTIYNKKKNAKNIKTISYDSRRG